MTQLAVLGAIAVRPAHGYGVRQLIETWRMHIWADIKYGSIYAALRNLEAREFIRAVKSDKQGGPTRTTYQLTSEGRRELRNRLVAAWSTPTRHVLSSNVALTFLPLSSMPDPPISLREISDLLRQRVLGVDALAKNLGAQAKAFASMAPSRGLGELLEDHFDHVLRLLEADRAWSSGVLARLDGGGYRDW